MASLELRLRWGILGWILVLAFSIWGGQRLLSPGVPAPTDVESAVVAALTTRHAADLGRPLEAQTFAGQTIQRAREIGGQPASRARVVVDDLRVRDDGRARCVVRVLYRLGDGVGSGSPRELFYFVRRADDGQVHVEGEATVWNWRKEALRRGS